MTSVETKVMVFAVLILGIGFVYTTINNRQGYTGQAVSDEAFYDYDSYASPYAGEDIISSPQSYQGDYEEAVTQVQPKPITYKTPESSYAQQKQVLMAVGIDKINVEEACRELDNPDHPFNSQAQTCREVLGAAQRDAAAS